MKETIWEEIKNKGIKLLEKELIFFLGKLEKLRSNQISLDTIRGLTIEQQGKKTAIKNIEGLNLSIDHSSYSLLVEIKKKELTKTLFPIIKKTILNSGLGFHPIEKNKEELRFALDVITEESKNKTEKEIKKISSDCQINFRRIRDNIRNYIKKEKTFSENEKEIYKKQLEQIINKYQEKLIIAEKKKILEIKKK